MIGAAAFAVVLLSVHHLAEHDRLGDVPWRAVLATQPLAILAAILVGLRLGLLLPSPGPCLRPGVEATFVGGGFGVLLPFRTAEVLKLLVLRGRWRAETSTIVGVLVLERVGDLLLLAGFTALVFAGDVPLGKMAVVASMIAAFLLIRPVSRRLADAMGRSASSVLRRTGRGIRSAGEVCAPLGLVKSTALALPAQVPTLLLTTMILRAVVPEAVDLRTVLALHVGATIGIGIGPAPAGLGTVEVAGVGALLALGWSLEDAIVATLALHLAYYLMLVPIGAIWMSVIGSGLVPRRP